MTAKSRCPLCGQDQARLSDATYEVRADDGVVLTYKDHLMRCTACGEAWYTHEQAMASSRARAAVLRRHAGLLTPDDIRALRDRLGLSQAQLETVLGTGPKTVVRWEKGTVCQSRAADRLLRLLATTPANLETMAQLSGVRLPRTGAST